MIDPHRQLERIEKLEAEVVKLVNLIDRLVEVDSMKPIKKLQLQQDPEVLQNKTPENDLEG